MMSFKRHAGFFRTFSSTSSCLIHAVRRPHTHEIAKKNSLAVVFERKRERRERGAAFSLRYLRMALAHLSTREVENGERSCLPTAVMKERRKEGVLRVRPSAAAATTVLKRHRSFVRISKRMWERVDVFSR